MGEYERRYDRIQTLKKGACKEFTNYYILKYLSFLDLCWLIINFPSHKTNRDVNILQSQKFDYIICLYHIKGF